MLSCRFRVHPPTNQPFAVFPPQNFSSPQLFQSSTVLPTWCDFDLLCSRRSASSMPTPPAFVCNFAPICTTAPQFNYATSVQICTTSLQLHHHSSIVHSTSLQLILLPSLAPAPMCTLHFSILPSVQFSCCNADKIAAPDQVHCN